METTQKKGILICKRRFGGRLKCQNVSGDNKLQLCEKHFNLQKEFLAKNPSVVSKNMSQIFGIEDLFLTKKKKEKEKKKEMRRKKKEKEKKEKNNKEKDLPPDEQRCCKSDGIQWRCKNVRMCFDPAEEEDDSNWIYCRQHYIYMQKFNNMIRDKKKKKKRSGDSEGEGAGCTTNCSNKRRKKTVVVEDDRSLDTSESDSTCIPNIGTKREDDLSVDKTEIQPATSDTYGKTTEGDSPSIGTKRKNIERIQSSGELEALTRTRDPAVELERLEHYKSECVKLGVELEKKNVECTMLKGKLAEVDTKITAVTGESKRTIANLESRVLRMEKDKSTLGCLESRISKLESLNLRIEGENSTRLGCVESRLLNLERSAKESSLLRCVEFQNSEKIVSEPWDLLNDVTQIGDKKRDENSRSKPNAETSSGGREDLHVYELKTKENVPKISSGSLQKVEMRPSQHHVEMSTKSSSESFGDDSDSSTDSKSSLGDLMEMMAMKYRNENKDKEIKWKSETEMVSSFEENPLLCMKAVCALYRQQMSEDEISAEGLFRFGDVVRVTTLAKFLMDEDCKADLNKSVEELEIFDSDAVDDCKRLAKRYSKQLFGVYQNGEDPYFLPTLTASHGDQAA